MHIQISLGDARHGELQRPALLHPSNFYWTRTVTSSLLLDPGATTENEATGKPLWPLGVDIWESEDTQHSKKEEGLP